MINNVFDCHIHALNKDDLKIYKKTAIAKYLINIRSIEHESLFKPFDFEEFKGCKGIFFLDTVNLDNLDEDLEKVSNNLKKYKRIIGIKIYIGYQHYYANDPKVYRVVDFAKKHKLSVTFHCGEIYHKRSDKSIFCKYSEAKNIKELLEKYPDVKFIACHLNWDSFDNIFSLCQNYSNIYTCFSGCNDGLGNRERKKQNRDIKRILSRYVRRYPEVLNKLMYGTDFFSCSRRYIDVSSYNELLKELKFNKEGKLNIAYNNVFSAYPKLRKLIKD